MTEEATYINRMRGLEPEAPSSAPPVPASDFYFAPSFGRGTEGLWQKDRLAPKGTLNPGVSKPEGNSFVLRMVANLTIRFLLAWGQLHVPYLVQMYYSLVFFMDGAVLIAMDAEFKRCYHPALLEVVPRRSLYVMENWELMLVMQLLVKPRDTRDFIVRVEDSLPAPPAMKATRWANTTRI